MDTDEEEEQNSSSITTAVVVVVVTLSLEDQISSPPPPPLQMLEHSLRQDRLVVIALLSIAHNGQQSNMVFHLPVTIDRRWSWTKGWDMHRPSSSTAVVVVVVVLVVVMVDIAFNQR